MLFQFGSFTTLCIDAFEALSNSGYGTNLLENHVHRNIVERNISCDSNVFASHQLGLREPASLGQAF